MNFLDHKKQVKITICDIIKIKETMTNHKTFKSSTYFLAIEKNQHKRKNFFSKK